METWVVLSLAGAVLQNIRAALQKSLTADLSVLGAAYIRFLFAVPFAWAYLLWLDVEFEPNLRFFGFALIGGLGQIAGTIWLLAAFTTRNFAVATALSKTETVQTVVLSLVVLGEIVSGVGLAGILISLAGVWLLNGLDGLRGGVLGNTFDRGFVNGLLSGFGFAIAAVCYRGAALSLPELEFYEQAACTLACTLSLQTLLFGVYLLMRERAALSACVRSFRRSIWVGLTGALASACWFSAMALVNASFVRALGQIELVLSFAVSILWFKEEPTRAEIVGVFVLTAGIVAVLVSRGL